jgi:hypothetical protein
MRRVADSLNEGGLAFLTAAINAPQPDHIFHFRTEADAERLAAEAGLGIAAKRTFIHPNRAGQNGAPAVFAFIAAKVGSQ